MLGCPKNVERTTYGRRIFWTNIFGGSTGGNEGAGSRKYVITWTSPKEQVFEMPTGGSAIMRQGNLLELARKEYCIAWAVSNFGQNSLTTKFTGFIRRKSNTCIRLMAS